MNKANPQEQTLAGMRKALTILEEDRDLWKKASQDLARERRMSEDICVAELRKLLSQNTILEHHVNALVTKGDQLVYLIRAAIKGTLTGGSTTVDTLEEWEAIARPKDPIG